MSADMTLSTMSGSKGNFTSIRIADHGNNMNRIPPLPKKKLPQRVFMRKSVSMDTMPTLCERKDNANKRRDLTDLPRKIGALPPQSGETSWQQSSAPYHENMNDSGYLTPADPPLYTESSFISGNTDFTSNSRPGISDNRNNFIARLDSGVGEGESIQGSASVNYNTSPHSPTSMTSCRLSGQYEDIDQYHRVHEQLHQEQHQQLQQRSDLKAEHDLPHTYHQLNTRELQTASHKPSTEQRSSCWLIMFLIILLLISSLALSLSIYDLVSKNERCAIAYSEMNGTSSDLDETLVSLQQKVNDLIKENEALKTALMVQRNNLTLVEQEIGHLSFKHQNLSYMLEDVKQQFDAEIANISLTAGPPGAPGVVNFSQCINQTSGRNAVASATDTTETFFLPSEKDLQNYFVIFAYCTYNGATDAYLETQFDQRSARQRYRCKCWGQVNGTSYTLCTVYVLMCPQTD